MAPVKRKDDNTSILGELEIKATSVLRRNDIDTVVVALCICECLDTILFIFDEQARSIGVLELIAQHRLCRPVIVREENKDRVVLAFILDKLDELRLGISLVRADPDCDILSRCPVCSQLMCSFERLNGTWGKTKALQETFFVVVSQGSRVKVNLLIFQSSKTIKAIKSSGHSN